MSSINHPDIRAALCSQLPCQLYRSVALTSRGWWKTLKSDSDYQAATRCKDLFDAALVGRRDMVELFISKGASNWDLGMHAAARGGHKDLVEFVKSKLKSDGG